MGSLLAGLKWDALFLAERPSFRSGSFAATPEPGPGGCGGTRPTGAAAFPSGRQCREAVRSVMRLGVCPTPPRPLLRTRNNAHRSC